jgi:thymidine kinase
MALNNSLALTKTNRSNHGSIDIIMGCMFSGKSTELFRLANRFKVLDKNLLIVNHSLDTRYSENAVATHSNQTMECLSISSFDEIDPDIYNKCDVLIIDEAQFFKGLYQFVLNACELDKKSVIVVGLDGDSNRTEFGEILKLIPVCDSVRKLYGLCVECKDGTKACFTKRHVENDEQVFIGTHEFSAVCREHYIGSGV